METEKYFEITCPGCKTILIIDRISGRIVESRKPLVEKTSGDRMKDAFVKYEDDKKGAEEKFEKMKEAEKNKKQRLDDLFAKSMEKVKKGGNVEKELRDIDLD